MLQWKKLIKLRRKKRLIPNSLPKVGLIPLSLLHRNNISIKVEIWGDIIMCCTIRNNTLHNHPTEHAITHNTWCTKTRIQSKRSRKWKLLPRKKKRQITRPRLSKQPKTMKTSWRNNMMIDLMLPMYMMELFIWRMAKDNLLTMVPLWMELMCGPRSTNTASIWSSICTDMHQFTISMLVNNIYMSKDFTTPRPNNHNSKIQQWLPNKRWLQCKQLLSTNNWRQKTTKELLSLVTCKPCINISTLLTINNTNNWPTINMVKRWFTKKMWQLIEKYPELNVNVRNGKKMIEEGSEILVMFKISKRDINII